MVGEDSVRSSAALREASALERYRVVRQWSEELARPLSAEDQMLQSMPEASPTKWHLAHTTWFFETFLLTKFLPEYRPFEASYELLFNSYYQSVGPQFPRSARGMLSRPALEEVLAYRRSVDEAMERLLTGSSGEEVERLLILGTNHEQQHQELILTDIKHALYQNPRRTSYFGLAQGQSADVDLERRVGEPRAPLPQSGRQLTEGAAAAPDFVKVAGGIRPIGADGPGFCFDNECPRHEVLLQDFALARTLLDCEAVLDFIEAGGYRDPLVWLSAGWDFVQAAGLEAPLYWERASSGEFLEFTLAGMRAIEARAPALHLSYFEADAIARHRGARLPTEAEWEVAARSWSRSADESSGEADAGLEPDAQPEDLFQVAWQWTSSAYAAYPGFVPQAGAVGEYNGKFMYNQMVLRGSSFATPAGHSRATYRNFFDGSSRWQFSGVRLAQRGR